MKSYLRIMRPKSWLKNVFVFVPITFAVELTDLDKLVPTIVAFAAFCLVSSAVYVFNDIFDADQDAAHPVKCMRPIASGAIKKPAAWLFFILLAVLGFCIAFFSNVTVLIFIAVYLLVNSIYTIWLKSVPIIDCFCIAAGFLLRVFTGGASYGGGLSEWLFLTVVAMS